MTVVGNDIVLNCKKCWCESGFSLKLVEKGGCYACPHCSTRYKVRNGFIYEVTSRF